MAEITAANVGKLREMTGAGLMDCKKALVETNGDLEKAVEYLRKKGIASAEKKAGRAANEGVIAQHIAARRKGRRARGNQLRDGFRCQERQLPGFLR